MNCKLCNGNKVNIIYDDYIRNGAVGRLTPVKYKMYQCSECNTIWHDNKEGSNTEFYESEEYRSQLENTADIKDYYRLHDMEVLEKLEYTGTDIYREKVVCDIGCGGGSFLDFVSNVAREIIAIEPSQNYRNSLDKKGYITFPYATEANKKYAGKVDVVTSFDVIEHVDSPYEFMKDTYELLNSGGQAIIGTPSDAPILRNLLGKEYEQFLFSFQHPWIIGDKGFEKICKEAGFVNVRIEQKQRYGLANTMEWLRNRKPKGHIKYDFINSTMEEMYKRELENIKCADYLIAYVQK